jgi:hypothetical protein
MRRGSQHVSLTVCSFVTMSYDFCGRQGYTKCWL